MDFETRIDPNVTNLLDRDPVTPTDIYAFHNGEGEVEYAGQVGGWHGREGPQCKCYVNHVSLSCEVQAP